GAGGGWGGVASASLPGAGETGGEQRIGLTSRPGWRGLGGMAQHARVEPAHVEPRALPAPRVAEPANAPASAASPQPAAAPVPPPSAPASTNAAWPSGTPPPPLVRPAPRVAAARETRAT